MTAHPSSAASSSRQPRVSSVATASATTSSSRQSSHLESLVHSLVPSIAPVRRRTVSASSSRPGSRLSEHEPVQDDKEVERERRKREKAKELARGCQLLLNDRQVKSTVIAPPTLLDTARRRLHASSPDAALRFNSAWHKLQDSTGPGRGKTLRDSLPHLQFLMALSDPSPLTSISMPPPPAPAAAPVASSSRTPRSATPASVALAETPREQSASLPSTPIPEIDIKGKTKAQILREWRTAHSHPPFPPHLLLRDVLYLLQGIDGRYIRFAYALPPDPNPYNRPRAHATELEIPSARQGDDVVGIQVACDEASDGVIDSPTRTLLVQLSELGMLYRRVAGFVKDREGPQSLKSGGMTEQSLCHFLQNELSEYHRLLAILESQMALTAPGQESGNGDGAGLTLRRLGVWTDETRLRMRMMSLLVEDAKTAQGGALVSRIHSHTDHGDPFVRKFTDQILEQVSKPFFTCLQLWIFSGELHDPFHEFFVQLNPDANASASATAFGTDGVQSKDEAHRVWEKKYIFVKEMVPGFVSEAFGKKIFSTGRSLNFIRYSCEDSDWILTQAKLANAGKALKYSDIAGLERSIDSAYSTASQRLLEIFFDKFSLLDHLRAIKAYLMLGSGDFAELLMEALGPRLSKPAISLYRHHLTSDLETAIRGSNAQYDSPDVLRRLDARVLEYSRGETGWDCFMLEYKVAAPLNAVLDGKAMALYERLFHHLWRLRRVETTLTRGWINVTKASRSFERIPNLGNDWHHCRLVQAEMVHFIRQMQAFCQLEVIECSWQSLLDFAAKREGDLDGLIEAHRAYLDRVVRKVLLLNNKRDREETLLDVLKEALELILQFSTSTTDLYAWSLAEATRLDRERDAERGLYTAPPSAAEVERSLGQLSNIRERIRECSASFQDRVTQLVQAAGGHADLDVRFLAIRIAFNGHYAIRRNKSKSGK